MQPLALDKPSASRDLGNVRRTSSRETEHHPFIGMGTRKRLAERFTQKSDFIRGKSGDRSFFLGSERKKAGLVPDPHVLSDTGPDFLIEFKRVVEPAQSGRIASDITG